MIDIDTATKLVSKAIGRPAILTPYSYYVDDIIYAGREFFQEGRFVICGISSNFTTTGLSFFFQGSSQYIEVLTMPVVMNVQNPFYICKKFGIKNASAFNILSCSTIIGYIWE